MPEACVKYLSSTTQPNQVLLRISRSRGENVFEAWLECSPSWRAAFTARPCRAQASTDFCVPCRYCPVRRRYCTRSKGPRSASVPLWPNERRLRLEKMLRTYFEACSSHNMLLTESEGPLIVNIRLLRASCGIEITVHFRIGSHSQYHIEQSEPRPANLGLGLASELHVRSNKCFLMDVRKQVSRIVEVSAYEVHDLRIRRKSIQVYLFIGSVVLALTSSYR